MEIYPKSLINRTRCSTLLATIYHNPRCSKSRETLKLLETAKVSTRIVLYLTDRLQKSDLVALLKKLNMTPIQLARRNERGFVNLKMNQEDYADEILIDAMINDPTLIERPIVVVGDKAVIGRPPENVLRLIQ